MLLEIHCHTSEKSSCSFVTGKDLIARAFEAGMDGIVLTDHHYLWPAEELAAIKAQSGVPEHFLVLSGQETTTAEHKDVLVYGADRQFAKGTTIEEIRTCCPQAALVWAHPYRLGGNPNEAALTDPRFDAIEILNSNHTFTETHRAMKDWHRLKFTATAGTDAHALSYVGTYPTLTKHPFETIEEFAEEIKAGRVHPDFWEVRRSGTTTTKVHELAVGQRHNKRQTFIVKEYEESEAWQGGDRAYRVMTAIRHNGFDQGSCRVPEPLAGDPQHKILIKGKARGKELYTVILQDDAERAQKALQQLAARWLARLYTACGCR